LRLLFVSHSLPRADDALSNVGGMQRVAVDLHDSLLAHPGITTRSLVLRSAWRDRHVSVPLFISRSLAAIPRIVKRERVDVVLFSSMVTAVVAAPLRRFFDRNGVRAAAIAYGLDVTTEAWPYPWIVPRTFAALDAVFPISSATAAECYARGLRREQAHVIPLGIRNDRFRGRIDRPTARRALLKMRGASESPAEPKLILASVGRLVPRKGVAWFVENVLPLLPEDIHYVVAGEGPERQRIQRAADELGVAPRVSLLGGVSEEELETVYRGVDVFVMPNIVVPGDIEGFGLVILEAGMCGLPVVAARLEGIQDVVHEGENGTLVTSGDAQEFSDAIMLYHAQPDVLRAASIRAAEIVSREFSWESVTERYVSALQQTAQPRRTRRTATASTTDDTD
jgi:phosphatidylinositol alpha-1,6-mannosyltransferase